MTPPFPEAAEWCGRLELLRCHVAGALVRRAVIVAGDNQAIVAHAIVSWALVWGAVVIAGFAVIDIRAVVVASFAIAAVIIGVMVRPIVVAAFTTVAAVMTAVATVMVAAFAAATAAFAAPIVVAAVAPIVVAAVAPVAATFTPFAAIGKGVGHAELGVQAHRQGGRETDGQRSHGGGTQQAAHPQRPQVALFHRKSLTGNGGHYSILLKSRCRPL